MRQPTRHTGATEFSIYRKAVVTPAERKGATTSLDAVYKRIRSGARGLDRNTRRLRQLLAKDDDGKAYRHQKARILPAATFSGIFSIRQSGVDLIEKWVSHSCYITIDIDGISPEQLPLVFEALRQHPNVLLAFVSPSGTGLKLICQVDPTPTINGDGEHKFVWQICKAIFDEALKPFSLQCDSGDDPTRLCFLAYDPNAIYNPDALPITWDRSAYQEQETARKQTKHKHATKQDNRAALEARRWQAGEIDETALDFINPDNISYDEWLCVMTACKRENVPMSTVDAWSARGTKHVPGDIERRWDKLNTTEASWGTVVYLARQSGYELPQRESPRKLYQIEGTKKQPLETLTVNRTQRERAMDTFLAAEAEHLHIQLVKEFTGVGKSYTTLVKGKQHHKRLLMNSPHMGLAKQVVETAYKLGFKNPTVIVGRMHNWEASGIADIPPHKRTAALFAKNNCLMCDVIQAYQEKRLAPRAYCETRCPFREGCLYLAQYEGLGHVDFLANCTPNLLFNLERRGYLTSLVTSSSEASDEDLAMDAIFGTSSTPLDDFDFAIIDDYTVNGLYSDVFLSESEFKTLKTAWKGTPTGKFAKALLKAFKKETPGKIFKTLRKAMKAYEAEHATITKQLTQHARRGRIEDFDRPKFSAESHKLLSDKQIRYTDGGEQWIPVDEEAHKELTTKGLPSIHPDKLQTTAAGAEVIIPHAPQRALAAGLTLDELTPVWQAGATPIDLLNILINSVSNTENAPVNLSRGVISFSIPPQAPVGLIPHITMLSATTKIEDTRRAFRGQAVTFSEHIGNTVKWAKGVKVYQYQDSKLTAASVFEYPKDTDGKRKLQEKPTGLTTTAQARIEKLNTWATGVDGKTAFISYKEFTHTFTEAVDGFDIVTHFDKAAGLNFEGLKYLVVFGYPKVRHDVVMAHGRTQFAMDSTPLPEGRYEELTQEQAYQEDGFGIVERRYKDARLEKVRHQLSVEKLEQALGRARLPLWNDTTSILFTNAPIDGITERTTLFSRQAFKLAESPSAIEDATQRITDAEAEGDVEAVMETQSVSQSTAYRKTEAARKQKNAAEDARLRMSAEILIAQGASDRKVMEELSIGSEKLSRILNR